jgi:hypothetical protein
MNIASRPTTALCLALTAAVLAACTSWTPEQLRARGQRTDLLLRSDYRAGASCVARNIGLQPGYSAQTTQNDTERTAEVRGRGWGSEVALLVQVADAPGGSIARIYTRGDSEAVRSWLRPCS